VIKVIRKGTYSIKMIATPVEWMRRSLDRTIRGIPSNKKKRKIKPT
jgi:hypothetical protein